jgi:single-strand DNA-binding protein
MPARATTSTTSTRSTTSTTTDVREHLPCRNAVSLRGRVSGAPIETTLPSGDVVVSVRVVVDREGRTRKPPYVDTIDCAAWSARARRSVRSWQDGDVVAIEGALRRRFWRSGSGAQSRYEVEIRSAQRLSRTGA